MVTALVAHVLSSLLGTLYPAYASFKAIKTKDINAFKRWMKYWICFAFFLVFEAFGDFLLYWLPFYYEAKIVLLVALLVPKFNGPEVVFDSVINPTLLTHEHDVDRLVDSINRHVVLAVKAFFMRIRTQIFNVMFGGPSESTAPANEAPVTQEHSAPHYARNLPVPPADAVIHPHNQRHSPRLQRRSGHQGD